MSVIRTSPDPNAQLGRKALRQQSCATSASNCKAAAKQLQSRCVVTDSQPTYHGSVVIIDICVSSSMVHSSDTTAVSP